MQNLSPVNFVKDHYENLEDPGVIHNIELSYKWARYVFLATSDLYRPILRYLFKISPSTKSLITDQVSARVIQEQTELVSDTVLMFDARGDKGYSTDILRRVFNSLMQSWWPMVKPNFNNAITALLDYMRHAFFNEGVSNQAMSEPLRKAFLVTIHDILQTTEGIEDGVSATKLLLDMHDDRKVFATIIGDMSNHGKNLPIKVDGFRTLEREMVKHCQHVLQGIDGQTDITRVTQLMARLKTHNAKNRDHSINPKSFRLELYIRPSPKYDIKPQMVSSVYFRTVKSFNLLMDLTQHANRSEMQNILKDKDLLDQIVAFNKMCIIFNIGAYSRNVGSRAFFTMVPENVGKRGNPLKEPKILFEYMNTIKKSQDIPLQAADALCRLLRTFERHFPNLPGLQEDDEVAGSFQMTPIPPTPIPQTPFVREEANRPALADLSSSVSLPGGMANLDMDNFDAPQLPDESEMRLNQAPTKHYTTPVTERSHNPGLEFGQPGYPEEIPEDDILPNFQPQHPIPRKAEMLADIRTQVVPRDEKTALVLGIAVILFILYQSK
jgi:hypothetical protein